MNYIRKNWFIAVFVLTLIFPLYGKLLDTNITLSGVTSSLDSVEATVDSLNDGTYQSYINSLWENEFPGKYREDNILRR